MNHDAEIKREKKAKKIMFKAAKIGGVGMGLLILSLIAPLIHQSDAGAQMQWMFVKYSFLMLAHVGAIVVTYVFMRKSIVIMSMMMNFIYLPSVVLLFAMEVYDMVTG